MHFVVLFKYLTVNTLLFYDEIYSTLARVSLHQFYFRFLIYSHITQLRLMGLMFCGYLAETKLLDNFDVMIFSDFCLP